MDVHPHAAQPIVALRDAEFGLVPSVHGLVCSRVEAAAAAATKQIGCPKIRKPVQAERAIFLLTEGVWESVA